MIYIFIAILALILFALIVIKFKSRSLPIDNKISIENQAIITLKSQIEFLQQQNQKQLDKIEELQNQNIQLEKSLTTSENNLIHLQSYCNNLENKHHEIETKFLAEFQNLAQKALEEKSSKFIEVNQKNFLPIFAEVNKAINELKINQVKQETDFNHQIANLMKETTKIGTEANNLVSALKNAKYQGNWGETILESILQNSGLIAGEHYFKNYNVSNDSNKNNFPDFLIRVPNDQGQKQFVVVDAKVSLTAYEKYCNSNNQKEQEIFLKEHLSSVERHIESLVTKQYHQLIDEHLAGKDAKSIVDFTIAFMPIEPAYLLAMQANRELWMKSFKNKVLLVSSTNFIICLKIIADLWNRQKQNQNSLLIVQQAEKLYEKIIKFAESFNKIGLALENANKNYYEATKQFRDGRGNIAWQLDKLKDLGLRSTKNLPSDLSNEINENNEKDQD